MKHERYMKPAASLSELPRGLELRHPRIIGLPLAGYKSVSFPTRDSDASNGFFIWCSAVAIIAGLATWAVA